MKTVTTTEMKELDRRATAEFKVPSLTLMENAGKGLAEAVLAKLKPKSKVMILCGKGNNGGDGLVAARYIANKHEDCEVLLLSDPGSLSDDSRKNYDKARKKDVDLTMILPEQVPVYLANDLTAKHILVDALFGIGLSRPLERPYLDIIEEINSSKAYVIAADTPSGLNADTGELLPKAVKAAETVTFAAAKKGFFEGEGPQFVGKISVVDIGIPEELLSKFD